MSEKFAYYQTELFNDEPIFEIEVNFDKDEDIFTRGAVDARELHEELQINTPFRLWITRGIENQRFVEGEDFRTFLYENGERGRPSQEYTLTLRAAKKLAMTVNSERGNQVREYFVEVEARYLEAAWTAPPHTMTEDELIGRAYLLVHARCEKFEKQRDVLADHIRRVHPKVEAFDRMLASKGYLCMNEAAKSANLPYAGKTLWANLRRDNIVSSERRTWNIPHAYYVSAGYFRVLPRPYVDKDGQARTRYQPVVTPKGIIWLNKKYYEAPEPLTI